MKRWLCFALSLLLFTAAGCAVNAEKMQVPVDFFYPYPIDSIVYNGEPMMMGSEPRESSGHEEDMRYLLNVYFQGPKSNSLTSPFPKDVTVVSYEITTDILTLELSTSFGQLRGIDLSIACACLTQTCFSIQPELTRVQISASDSLLDGSKWVTMTRDSLMLLDSSALPVETAQTPTE